MFRSYVKRFLCLFNVNPALENNFSLWTDIATDTRYLTTTFHSIELSILIVGDD